MERLDYRRTSNTALVEELRRRAGLDEAGNPSRHDASAGDREPDPWAGRVARARITLERLSSRHGASRLPRGQRV